MQKNYPTSVSVNTYLCIYKEHTAQNIYYFYRNKIILLL